MVSGLASALLVLVGGWRWTDRGSLTHGPHDYRAHVRLYGWPEAMA